MKMECLEQAIDSGLQLHSWEDSQSSGVWLALGDSQFILSEIQILSKKGLKENIWLKNFSHDQSDNLLIILSEAFDSALQAMEIRLTEMPNSIYQRDSHYRKHLKKIYMTIAQSN